jgi:hypothetical protein
MFSTSVILIGSSSGLTYFKDPPFGKPCSLCVTLRQSFNRRTIDILGDSISNLF